MRAYAGFADRQFRASEPVDRHLGERMMLRPIVGCDQGYFIEENVGLGHRRLSIIDLSR
jgi:asparagine synthetase B (glutamine-hydrolysing)